jgi:adenylate kinase
MKPETMSQAGPRAIVVTGTPGTGKTAVSKSLANQIGANYLSLTQLVIDKRLDAAIDRHRRTRVVDLERTRACLRKFLSNGKPMTVVDTHVPDAVPREHVRKVIVLRCHPKVLEARLRRKGWMGSKIRENLLAEILDSCYVTAIDYHGARKTDQLDTSRVSLSKCVSQAKRILTKQAAGKVRVDWIGVLSRERSLEKYLR